MTAPNQLQQRGERGEHYRVRLYAGTQPVTKAAWADFLSRRLIRQIGKHLAVLCEGVVAFTTADGKFDLEFIEAAYVRNSWRAWEIAWLYSAQANMPASVAVLGLFAKQEYVISERKRDIENEAASWRLSRMSVSESLPLIPASEGMLPSEWLSNSKKKRK